MPFYTAAAAQINARCRINEIVAADAETASALPDRGQGNRIVAAGCFVSRIIGAACVGRSRQRQLYVMYAAAILYSADAVAARPRMPRAVAPKYVVWCEVNRRPVLTSGIEARLVESIIQSAALLRHQRSIALEVMPDHVHLVIETDPRWRRQSSLVTSKRTRTVRMELPDLRRARRPVEPIRRELASSRRDPIRIPTRSEYASLRRKVRRHSRIIAENS